MSSFNIEQTPQQQLAGSMPRGGLPAKAVPYHLVLIESRKESKNKADSDIIKIEKFIAVKVDQEASVIKMIGVDSEEKVESIVENYLKIIKSADKTLFKEITVPWLRVLRVQSLTFKTNNTSK